MKDAPKTAESPSHLVLGLPWIWWFGFVAIILLHGIWEARNDLPPVWDMAYHQIRGWNYLHAWQQGEFLTRLSEPAQSYPPLYYLQEALILAVFSNTQWLPLLANLPGLFLLSFFTARMALFVVNPFSAACAGLLALLFPMVAWVSRESLLDGSLAGWAAAGGFLILRSRFFDSTRWTLLFGVICAAGALTKWTFPLYLAFPVLYVVIRLPRRRRTLLNLLAALLVALPFLLSYYGPNLLELISRYPTTDQAGLIPWKPYPRHGEPGLNNVLGWIYYPRVILSYFLFFPLTLFFVVGALRSVQKEKTDESVRLFWWWLLGGMLLLIFLTPKDPRFALPLVPPLAILLVVFWARHAGWVYVLMAVAFAQFLLVSFPSPVSPLELALFQKKDDRDYQTLQREWVLFQTHYFDVAGPPRREYWPYAELVQRLPEDARVGFLPELPRFHPEALRLAAIREGHRLEVYGLGESEQWPLQLEAVDYLVTKTGWQGISFITTFNTSILSQLEQSGWVEMAGWNLPDGSKAKLWRRPSVSSQ